MFTLATRTITYHKAYLVYARIPWDSKALRNRTAEIKEFSFATTRDAKFLLSRLIKELNFGKGDLLFLKTSPLRIEFLRTLARLGFYFVEEAIEITCNLIDWNPESFPQHKIHDYHLVPAASRHLPSMRKIAGTAFIADRYHLDTTISAVGANRRFTNWIETSMKGYDEVFAFVDTKNTVVGFFIIAKHDGSTNLRLAAISPALVGKGLGKLLYFTMFSLLQNRGDTTITTQISLSNSAVFNVYTYLVHPKITQLQTVWHYHV